MWNSANFGGATDRLVNNMMNMPEFGKFTHQRVEGASSSAVMSNDNFQADLVAVAAAVLILLLIFAVLNRLEGGD
jgi:hypothetical protein